MSELTERDKIAAAVVHRDEMIIERHGPGTITMDRCVLCGYMRFVSSQSPQTQAASSVTFVEMQPVDCSRCGAIHMRAPEVFDWVMGVAAQLRVRMAS